MTLVTGASGFVGSHLLQEMQVRHLPVRGVTRGTVPGLVTVLSYGPEMDWSKCLQGVDSVIHLAARVHVTRETASNPLSLFRQANVAATVNLARQAAEAGVRRFVFVSTIKVNGERTEPGKPFTADDRPNPQDAYGISKAEAEAALKTLCLEKGMEFTIVRPPLVYGPGVKGNFRSFMKWAESGLPSIFEAVKNKRSFVHVANLCDLLIKVLDHPNASNRIFLVSDGRDLSTHELFERLALQAGRTPRSVAVAPAILHIIGRLTHRSAAVERLTQSLQIDACPTSEQLGWHPAAASGIERLL